MIATTQTIVAELAQDALQAAHDIQSPVMALQAVLSSIDGLDEQKKKLVQAALKRVQEITESLMKKYRKKAEAPNSHEPNQNLRTLINQIVSEKKFLLPPEICIQSKLDGDLEISFERAKSLRRMLSNFLNNSVEAIYKKSDRGEIQIKLTRIEDDIVMSIEDNGCGIPHDVLSQVGQLGFTYGKKNGHGLGLSGAKKIMKQWNGQMMIDSVTGEYSRVTLVFPNKESIAFRN